MECLYLPNTVLRRTPVYRLFSVSSVISFYVFDNISSDLTKPLTTEVYDFWQFFYLKEGSALYGTDDGHQYIVKAGQLICRPPYTTSYIKYLPETRNSVYIVSFECASQQMDCFNIPPVELYGEEILAFTDFVEAGTRIFESVEPQSHERGLRMKPDVPSAVLNYVITSLERFLNMLCCRLTYAKYYHDESEKINQHIHETMLVTDIRSYLADNLDKNISIDELAHHFGINSVTLMKLFKRETGTSIISYFTTQKINEAMRLISCTSLNFSEISEMLGFTSVNYFTRVFKKQLGITPTEFSRRQPKKITDKIE